MFSELRIIVAAHRLFAWAFTLIASIIINASLCVAEQPLVVGFIGGFSGPGQAYGEACKNGFELGLKDEGGRQLRVIYEDDQFDPKKTVAAFRKLVDFEHVQLVIVLGSSPAKSIAPLAERAKVPLIAWASDPSVATGRKYVVRSWARGDEEGKRIAQEAVQRGYGKLAFFSVTDDYSLSVRSGFARSIPADQLVIDEEVALDAQDFKPRILNLKRLAVDTIGLCVSVGQSGMFAKQATELGLRPRFFGCETLYDDRELEISQGALAGTWFVTGVISEKFRARYRSAYGNESVLSGAAIHYDIARVLKELDPQLPPLALIDSLFDGRSRSGGMEKFTIVRRDGDQFFDVELAVKEISG